ncbi:MAG: TIGR04013 family B12-binding domain/radical SAM domain-containing protein [Acidobacteria bacterium]|nr:TIGR04013 family B12-binding domain/radical SAM domain-containing protein [Acidobacteriota bacterium]
MRVRTLPDMLSLIFYYHRLNRYSFNALAGALDSDPELAESRIHLARTPEELRSAAAALLERHDHIIVALSVLTPQFAETRSLIRLLRADHGARITVICGGPHAIARAADTLQSGADIVFCGEAEESFPAVLRRLAAGGEFRDIAGIAIRRDNEVVVNSRALPADIEAFSSFSPERGMFGPIEITRGCPFACSYCQTSHIFGVRPRHRSISAIARQAETLRSKYGRVVRLLSPNAFSYGSPDGRQLNPAALHDLLSALRETVSPGGRIIFGHYPSEVRPEHVTPDTLGLLRRFADNDEIVIGAQSGSQRMLEACRRSHTVDEVVTAVSLARRFGYKVIVDFIFGLPGESEPDRRETVAVLESLSRLGARIHPHAFVPLPQTAFSAERPGRVSSEVIRALERLKVRGAIYGDWVAQRRLANHVWKSLGTQASE